MSSSNKEIKERQTSLETANEMYKAAFLMKKERFAKENPQLSEKELLEFTSAYFRNLHKVNHDRSN